MSGSVERSLDPSRPQGPILDYAIVVEGEIWALMDLGETLMTAGDVLIQRSTNHAWSNRSDRPARVCFVLNGA